MAVDANPNAEATQAWEGPLFERFKRYRTIVTSGGARHSGKAFALHPPPEGARVLDVGCGFGDTADLLAELVGPSGSVQGVDVAPNFIASAENEYKRPNLSFALADVQFDDLGGPYDYVFSRFGVMFFDNPGAAMRNIRKTMTPGAQAVFVVWRTREDNPWIYEPQLVVEKMLGRPEEYDDPTCGPGPFSLAGADTTSGILVGAGFHDVTLTRVDLPIPLGRDVDEALDVIMALGPAGELIRLWGDRKADQRDEVRSALREVLSQYLTDRGVEGMASTWVVSAVNPADN